MQNESSIKEIIANSLSEIRTMIDADTIIGKQIVTASGTVIIPVSKLSVGFVSGGLDLPKKGQESKSFGGGGGTGVSVSPVGFLTVYPDGRVEMLPMKPGQLTPVEQAVDALDQIPAILEKFKAVFKKKTVQATEEEEAEAVSDMEEEIAVQLAEELVREEPQEPLKPSDMAPFVPEPEGTEKKGKKEKKKNKKKADAESSLYYETREPARMGEPD